MIILWQMVYYHCGVVHIAMHLQWLTTGSNYHVRREALVGLRGQIINGALQWLTTGGQSIIVGYEFAMANHSCVSIMAGSGALE